MRRSAFASLLSELLDGILDNVESRQDILSLALSCSFFASIIIPERLGHHTIVASPYHITLWTHLAEHHRLASYVRNLVLHDDPRQGGPQNDRWRLPPCCGDSATQYTVGKYDSECMATALQNMRNVTRLNLRYARTTHLRAAMPTLPNTLSLLFVNLTSLEHVSTSTRLSPVDDDALRDCAHPIWSLSGLKSLDLDISEWNESLWPSFQAILSRSPNLEDLRLPDFLTEDTMAELCTFRFPSLKRLDRAFSWSMPLTMHIVHFLYAHPTIEVLHWPMIAPTPVPRDALPCLKHLSAPNPAFLTRFLDEQASESVALESLTNVALTADLVGGLAALEPHALRVLHIESLDSYASLCALAARFPNIVELQLPRRGAWKENARFVTRLARAMLRPWIRDLHLLSLADALSLFPALEVVRGVRCPSKLNPEWDADDPRALAGIEELKATYPRLRKVNRWRLWS